MAYYGSDQVAMVLLSGYNLLTNTIEFQDNIEPIIEETTVLGNSWVQQQPVNVKKAELTVKGFYDDAALQTVEALSTRTGTIHVASYGVAGSAAGRLFTGFAGAAQVDVERVASRGGLHKINTKFLGSGAVEEGRILRQWGTSTTSTGNTQASSYDAGSSSTAGGSGYLQVTRLTMDGGSSWTGYVRHSADNVTFADLVTFTGNSSVSMPAAERSTVSGGVNRYLAAAHAFGGISGASRTVDFFVGFARNT